MKEVELITENGEHIIMIDGEPVINLTTMRAGAPGWMLHPIKGHHPESGTTWKGLQPVHNGRDTDFVVWFDKMGKPSICPVSDAPDPKGLN
jgi:hypothetical protein